MPPKSTRSGEYIETDNGNKISRRAQLHATQHIILAGKSVIQHDVIIRGDLVRQQPPPPTSKPTLDPSSTTSKPHHPPTTQTVSIHLGRYVFISPGCTLHPPSRLSTPSSSSSSSSFNSNTTNLALTSTSLDLVHRRASAQAPPPSPFTTQPPTPIEAPSTGYLPKPSSVHPTSEENPPTTTSSLQQQQQSSQILTHHPLRISSHVYLGPSTYCAAASIGSHVYIGARCTVGNMVIIKDNVRVEDDTVMPPMSVWRSGVVVAGRPGRVVGEVGSGWANGSGGEGGAGGIGAAAGMEGWGRDLWASVGNHVRKGG